MARIRSAKPEWWTSAKWCRLSRDIRSTYKGIWEVMCDDEGRFLADPRQVKADVWPLDDDITPKKLATWLPKLAEVTVTNDDGTKGPAVVFYEVDHVKYGFLPGFVKHQKISHSTPSKLPKPPSIDKKDSGTTPEPPRNDSGNAPEKLRLEVEEDVDVDFEEDVDRDVDLEEEVDVDASATSAVEQPYRPTFVEQLLEIVPSATAWQAEIDAMLAGMPGHFKATPAQIETAAKDLIANGKTENPSLRQFRRYVEAAKPDGFTGNGKRKQSPMERSLAQSRAAFGTPAGAAK